MPKFRHLLEPVVAHDPENSAKPIDHASLWALAYIAIPNLIFYFGWLRLPIAATLAAGTLYLIYRQFLSLDPSKAPPGTWRSLAPLFAIALLWCWFGGAGHFSYANSDWMVRDAVLGDLIHSHWPPAYQVEAGQALLLRSAYGYFLPAALLASIFGTTIADVALYFWTVAGVILFLRLLPINNYSPRHALLFIAIVIAFSGLDLLGILVVTGEWPLFPLRPEWWTRFSYSSLSGQLFWAPNHTLPLWIGTVLFYRHWGHPQFFRYALVFVPLTLIWTPFAALAFLPFLGIVLLRWWVVKMEAPSACEFALALLISVLVSAFLTIRIDGIAASTSMQHADSTDAFITSYLVFTITEFGIVSLLLARRLTRSRNLFALSVFVLLSLPFVVFGPSNDLLLRVSVPPLIVLALLSAQTIVAGLNQAGWRNAPWTLIAVLLIGAYTPFCEFWRAATWKAWPANYQRPLSETQPKGDLPAHYVGRIEASSPWHWILKSPRLIPDRRARGQR